MNVRQAPFAAATLLLFLAACAAPPDTMSAKPGEHITARTSTASPRLPGRIVHTDGHGDIYLTGAGQARCLRTDPAQAAAALAATNSVRAARGLAPLTTNARVQQAAEDHACDMAQRGTMTHVGQDTKGPSARLKKRGYAPRVAAENIAAGRFDQNRVLAEWAQSPGHLSNMLIGGLHDMGIGQAVAADGKTTFWSAVYSRPKR